MRKSCSEANGRVRVLRTPGARAAASSKLEFADPRTGAVSRVCGRGLRRYAMRKSCSEANGPLRVLRGAGAHVAAGLKRESAGAVSRGPPPNEHI